LWNQLLLKESVAAKLLPHLGHEIVMRIVVELIVLEEEAKLAIKATLNILAIFHKMTTLGSELVLLMLSVDMTLQPLDRRYPSRLTNECCDFLNSWLDIGKDLNAGRPVRWLET
jgi:hypothetical protein